MEDIEKKSRQESACKLALKIINDLPDDLLLAQIALNIVNELLSA